MKSLWLKVLPLLICLLLAAGCGSAVKLSNVLVDIIEYHPTTSDTQAKLTLRFTNENVFPIAIAGTTSKLYLNGTYVGKIESSDPVGMPQLSATNRNVVLTIENTALIQQLRSTASTPSISYRLESTMRMQASEEKMKIRNVSNGQINAASLRAEPAITPKS